MSTSATRTTPTTFSLLSISAALPSFLSSVTALSPPPLTVAKVANWIHPPETISVDSLITGKSWDVLLLLRGTTGLPESLRGVVKDSWSIHARVPTEMVDGFEKKNMSMLHPKPEEIPKLPTKATGNDSSEKIAELEPLSIQISPELDAWFHSFSSTDGAGPVSMLNFLTYANKEQYMGYVKAFGDSVGSRYGGTPKIIGEVISGPEGGETEWDDMVVVQYPSITHFADMLASEEYAKADRKYKVGALKDTGLLCVVEVDLQKNEAV